MEPSHRPQTRNPRATATVAVAELLARHAGETGPSRVVPVDAAPDADPDRVPTAPISVPALLRREGAGPHRVDRPLQPRGHSRPGPGQVPPGARIVRKATTAAGVLFAAGAVFGNVLVDDVVSRPADPGDDVAGLPGGVGEGEVLRAFGAQAAGTGVEPDPDAPVTGFALASAAFLFAGKGAHEQGDPFGIAGTPRRPGGPVVGSDTGAPGARGGGQAEEPGSGPGSDAARPPEVATPPVALPGGGADVAVVGPVHTAVLALSGAQVAPPQVAPMAGGSAAGAATSTAAVQTPDLRASAAGAGPLRVSRTEVDVPDVAASAARVGTSADARPELRLRGVAISGAEVTTPDSELGPAEVELPDVELPGVELPAVSPARDGGDEAGESVDAPVDDAADEVAKSAGSPGEAAARALDEG